MGTYEEHKKNIVKIVRKLSRGRYATWQIWQDFVAMASCSISNAVDILQKDKREEEYLSIAKRYTAEELDDFTKIFGETILALEAQTSDVLGECYMELELYSEWKGQYFTPASICRMMADMLSTDEAEKLIASEGFVTVMEPSIGSGAMVIGLLQSLRAREINYQQTIHVTGWDIDSVVLGMAYIQLSLLYVPARLVVGNTLSLEVHSVWLTPAHVLGLWEYKLRKKPEGSHDIVKKTERKGQQMFEFAGKS